MPSSRDNDYRIDSEVAQARVEHLLEDNDQRHDITFKDLSNLEVLTLATAFTHAIQMFGRNGNEQQATFIHHLERNLQEEASPLFDKLSETVEEMPNETNASSSADKRQSKLSQISTLGTPPGGDFGSESIENRIWRMGILLIIVQGAVAIFNLSTVLLNYALPSIPALNEPFYATIVSIVGVTAVTCFSFAMGRTSKN